MVCRILMRTLFGRKNVTREKFAVMMLLVVLGCCLLVMGGCKGAAPTTTPTATTSPSSQPSAPAAEPAKPKTTVMIEAYYPLNESHKFIADYLKEMEKANPGKVTVTVYDMQSEEGRKKWSASGLSCAGIFVNGSTHHEITKNGKTEGVDFLQRMDVFFAHEDFETVVKNILEKAGQTFTPPPAPSAPKTEATPSAEQPAKAGESAKTPATQAPTGK